MSMTVDAWFQSRKGQSLLVPGASEADRGQCMQAADYALNEIYGLPYVWANAIDCWNKFDQIPQLKGNFTKVTDGSVKKGDFVIFNESVGSVYGHIDLAMADGSTSSFTGADSNWGGNKTLHLVAHNNKSYIIGALRPKQGGEMPITQGQLDKLIKMGKQDEPRADELNNKDWMNDPGLAVDAIWAGYGNQVYSHRVSKGDIDNLLKDVGITPTQADYDTGMNYAVTSPKDFAYWLQGKVKNAPQANATTLKPGDYHVN